MFIHKKDLFESNSKMLALNSIIESGATARKHALNDISLQIHNTNNLNKYVIYISNMCWKLMLGC